MCKIIFDKNNANWNRDERANFAFVRSTEVYLNALVKYRGYLYMNQIYEALGACWSPEEENRCLIYNEEYTNQFEFEMFHKKNGEMLIIIIIKDFKIES